MRSSSRHGRPGWCRAHETRSRGLPGAAARVSGAVPARVRRADAPDVRRAVGRRAPDGRGGWGDEAQLWARAVLDLLVVAPREHWHVLKQDLRYAFRSLKARPGFASVAIL